MSAIAATMRRPADDRVVLGVCAAIARRFDLDPTLVRVIAAIGLVVLTTPFLVAYAGLALVVPREDGRMLIGGDPPDRRETVIGWIIVTVAAGLLIATPTLFGLGGDVDVFEIGMLLVAASLVGLALSRSGALDGAGKPESEAPAASAPVATAATTTEQMPGTGTAGTAETAEVATTPLVPAPRTGAGGPGREPKAPKAPKQPSIFGPVFAAIVGLIGFGAVTVAVFDIELTAVSVAVIAGGLAVVCGGTAIAMYGRRGTFPLIALGTVLALVAVTAAVGADELDRGIGYREAQPVSATEIEDGYEIGAGFIQVDLRDARLPAGETVMPLHVGYGAAEVIVPRDLEVVSTGETVTGELAADPDAAAGGDASGDASAGDNRGDARKGDARAVPEPPVLVIDAEVDVGSIDLTRQGVGG